MTALQAHRVRLTMVVVLLAFIHFAVRPIASGWFFSPNLLVCAVLMAARYVRPGTAAGLGFLLGLLEDSVAVSYFGLATLLLVGMGYLGSRTRDYFLGEEFVFLGIYLMVGTWMYEAAGYIVVGGSVETLALRLFVRAPLDAVATAIAGYLILPLTASR